MADQEETTPAPDPRLKVLKKFRGRFLPKGRLRERHRELIKRWDSGDDHGGVTLEELKSLLDDWRTDQARRRGERPAQPLGTSDVPSTEEGSSTAEPAAQS